jgi:hypothetical protein
MASELRLDFLQSLPEYIGKDRFEIANHLAKHDGYIAIVQFESMGTYFGCCRTIEELEEVLGSPNCKMREVIYHIPGLKDSLVALEAKGVLKYSVPSAPAKTQSPQPAPKAQSVSVGTTTNENKKPQRPIAGYILVILGGLIALAAACLSLILLVAYLSDPELSNQMGQLRIALLVCGAPLFLLGLLMAAGGVLLILRSSRDTTR